MADIKETASSRQNKADVRVNSQSLLQHAQDLPMFKPDKTPARRRGNGHGVLFLTTKLFAIDSYWGREDRFSSIQCYWAHQPDARV